MKTIPYGIQLYSLRDLCQNDLRAGLREVAKMGYSSVEFAGFFDNGAEDVKSWLDEEKLTAAGTHTGLALLTPETIDETIAYHRAIGCKNLTVPGADWSTLEKMNENIAALNFADGRLRAAGIRLAYHNHSGEFLTTPYGKTVIDEILEKTSIDLQVDTFWSFNAGIDTIAFLDGHADRIHTLHLKDGYPRDPKKVSFSDWFSGTVGTSVGEGIAPVLDVIEWGVCHHADLIVESEGLDPNGTEEVRRCIEYLRSIEE